MSSIATHTRALLEAAQPLRATPAMMESRGSTCVVALKVVMTPDVVNVASWTTHGDGAETSAHAQLRGNKLLGAAQTHADILHRTLAEESPAFLLNGVVVEWLVDQRGDSIYHTTAMAGAVRKTYYAEHVALEMEQAALWLAPMHAGTRIFRLGTPNVNKDVTLIAASAADALGMYWVRRMFESSTTPYAKPEFVHELYDMDTLIDSDGAKTIQARMEANDHLW